MVVKPQKGTGLKIVPLTDDGQAPNHRAHNPKNYYYYMIYVIFFFGLDTP